jgi:hypothetical protein
MEVMCKKCRTLCEFDPEEHGYMTWCNECNDYPQTDIDAANIDYISGLADHAKDMAKEGGR